MTDWTQDRESGSSDLALGFLAELERFCDTDSSPSAPGLRLALLRRLRAAQAAQPTMALIHQLAARALDVVSAGVAREDRPAALRAHLARSCAQERKDLEEATQAVARTAASLVVERGAWIATLSASGAVRAALLHAKRVGREPCALVAEGRPRVEGRALAAALAQAGIPVWLVADAALPLLLSHAAQLWIGADAVTEAGAINKIGSYAAALAARERSVPAYALAGRRKFIPAATPALRIVEMPPAELWEAPPPGVEPRNIYFELVPTGLLRGIVVEGEVLGPTESATLARERALPQELAAVPGTA
jgi:translation initiation factor 2B subunit (eIF-2B alpha/beta/delta family)